MDGGGGRGERWALMLRQRRKGRRRRGTIVAPPNTKRRRAADMLAFINRHLLGVLPWVGAQWRAGARRFLRGRFVVGGRRLGVAAAAAAFAAIAVVVAVPGARRLVVGAEARRAGRRARLLSVAEGGALGALSRAAFWSMRASLAGRPRRGSASGRRFCCSILRNARRGLRGVAPPVARRPSPVARRPSPVARRRLSPSPSLSLPLCPRPVRPLGRRRDTTPVSQSQNRGGPSQPRPWRGRRGRGRRRPAGRAAGAPADGLAGGVFFSAFLLFQKHARTGA